MAALTKVTRTDPFHFPKEMVPLGLTYQWQAKAVLGEPDPRFDKMITDGWTPVPAQWHRPYFDCPDGPVVVRGQWLLCHAAAKDEEAERIAGAARNIENWAKKYGGEFSGGVRIQYQDARGASPMIEAQLGKRQIAEKVAPSTSQWVGPPLLSPLTPLIDAPAPTPLPVRVERHWALRWIFNLVSVEKDS